MSYSRNKKTRATRRETTAALIESLEQRQLLSASNIVMHSNLALKPASSTTSSTVQGFTPAQIRQAYGFSNITFSNGTVPGDGAGQTIAIVDAYNDPNITSDLKTFDTQFGIAAPASFSIVSQTGNSTKLPSTDSGWAGEISLDVEWAHAIAPGAKILLVEANSDSLDDLMTAVNYARHASGVSTVSMSWGGSEFFSWSQGEFSGQTAYDPYFTTPTGHQGVTFVAAAGDSGSFSGIEWPASSPNVLSVGGTSLTLDSSGNYASETSWSSTTGGYSAIEVEPSYQANVQNTGARSTPDVAFDGDPNTGFAVYDSLPDQGYSGWQEVGGTSAGAPAWAGLVAIADQGRAILGQGTLDGASQTLPLLYSIYTTATATDYANDFNDVVDPTPTRHGRFGGGGSINPATTGYDTATGLGSPHAANIVGLLGGQSSSSSGSGSSGSGSSGSGASGSGSTGSTGSTGSGSTGGSGTNTASQLPASPVDVLFIGSTPASVLEGGSGTARIRITNTQLTRFKGPVSITLYASASASVTGSDTLLTTTTVTRLNLKAGGSQVVNLRFTYPTSLANSNYYLVASATAIGTGTADAEAATPAKMTIAKPFVDLATVFGSTPISVTPGAKDTAIITIENVGNITANGLLGLKLYASTGDAIDSSAQLLATVSNRRVALKAGKSMTFKVKFTAPAASGSTYNIIASSTSSTKPADTNAANDIAVTTTV